MNSKISARLWMFARKKHPSDRKCSIEITGHTSANGYNKK